MFEKRLQRLGTGTPTGAGRRDSEMTMSQGKWEHPKVPLAGLSPELHCGYGACELKEQLLSSGETEKPPSCVLGCSRDPSVQRPFPQLLLFLCMPIHFSSLCESPFVHLEEAMLCCNSERFTLRLFSGQFYWRILSSGTLGTSSSPLQLHQPPSSRPHTRAVQAYTQLRPLPDVDSSLVFVGIKSYLFLLEEMLRKEERLQMKLLIEQEDMMSIHLLKAEEDEVLRGNGLLRTGKSPLPVKNFGIWLRYDLITAGTGPPAHGAPCPGPLNPGHEGGGGRSQQVPETSSSAAAGSSSCCPTHQQHKSGFTPKRLTFSSVQPFSVPRKKGKKRPHCCSRSVSEGFTCDEGLLQKVLLRHSSTAHGRVIRRGGDQAHTAGGDMFGFPTATLLDCHGRYAQNVAFFRDLNENFVENEDKVLTLSITSRAFLLANFGRSGLVQ
ncbi:hypothetical protein MJG53_019057 [Ovis ammon polii x Ovis aries]|uniref:Uncharacterized protein n=1 Tax=Ovis ammon polii x Ovis aries TaxID=2918886 RepID=A0ACB9U2G9_9CETA|nr:hypothetical protein MJG53_019057 [Ovis ammon polii x Ovis aries]